VSQLAVSLNRETGSVSCISKMRLFIGATSSAQAKYQSRPGHGCHISPFYVFPRQHEKIQIQPLQFQAPRRCCCILHPTEGLRFCVSAARSCRISFRVFFPRVAILLLAAALRQDGNLKSCRCSGKRENARI
jgi:hypothetical protein